MPDPIVPADLDRITATCEAATPGPWYWRFLHKRSDSFPPSPYEGSLATKTVQGIMYPSIDKSILNYSDWYLEPLLADRKFIVEARTDLPRLVSALRAAWRERDTLKAELVTLVDLMEAGVRSVLEKES